ncbi:MAG: glycoside hydrolase family 2 TIM barrel-domain containing protein [Pseudomonadota bacterium]
MQRMIARIAAVLVCALTFGVGAVGAPPTVRIVASAEGGYSLERNGAPYYIRGGGGWTFLDELVAAGGNSIRTWGHETIDPVALDEAAKRGLTVTAGLWLPHPSEGFDYSDARQVKRLVSRLRTYVRRHRNHPALLLWGVGNEMEIEGANADLWRTVEAVAAMVRREDPRHPTITVLAEVTQEKIDALRAFCPSIDALGVNSYSSVFSLPDRLKTWGWTKPYVLTEFGPPGPWGQVPVTDWGAPLEPTSTEKAEFYARAYREAVAPQKNSLGSYVYFWGIEPAIVVTHTWYEMFLPGGGNERLGAVEAMTQAWTAKSPANLAPRLLALHSSVAQSTVSPDSLQSAFVEARDPDGDELRARWEVRAESKSLTGAPPAVIPDSIRDGDAQAVTFTAPRDPGAYRLFVYLYDGHGNAATANFPFRVSHSETARAGNP